MTKIEALKYQQTIDLFMDTPADKAWLAECVLKSSPYMTNEHCRMIEITLFDGKGAGYRVTQQPKQRRLDHD